MNAGHAHRPDTGSAARAALEALLIGVEVQLQALAAALAGPDAAALDAAASRLHTALAAALGHFAQAARSGSLPAELRHRLALAGAQVAAQREALARATASLDRALDVLLPGPASAGLYSAFGNADRLPGPGGRVLA